MTTVAPADTLRRLEGGVAIDEAPPSSTRYQR
jgi:hypothetical protein